MKKKLEVGLTIIAVICVGVFCSWGTWQVAGNHERYIYRQHVTNVRNNLAAISDNQPLLGNKNTNGKFTIIFYRHNCPHCQAVIPKNYVNNQLNPTNYLHNHQIEYRDVINKLNDNIAMRTIAGKNKNYYVPTKALVTIKHGRIVHVVQTPYLNKAL